MSALDEAFPSVEPGLIPFGSRVLVQIRSAKKTSCKEGEFVRVAKYGGDRWKVPFGKDGDEEALFVIFNDLDIVGGVVGDPLAIKAFI